MRDNNNNSNNKIKCEKERKRSRRRLSSRFLFFAEVDLNKNDDEENDAITNKRTKKGKKKEVLLSLVFKTLAMISFLSVMHMRDNDTGATILTREPIIIIIDQLWRGVVNIS